MKTTATLFGFILVTLMTRCYIVSNRRAIGGES